MCGPRTGLHPEWTCVWGCVQVVWPRPAGHRDSCHLPHGGSHTRWMQLPPLHLNDGARTTPGWAATTSLGSCGFRALPPPHFGSSKPRPKNVNWFWDVRKALEIPSLVGTWAPAGSSPWSMRLTPDSSGDTPGGGRGGGAQLHSSKAWRPCFQGRAEQRRHPGPADGGRAGGGPGRGFQPFSAQGAGVGGGQAKAWRLEPDSHYPAPPPDPAGLAG